MAIATVKGPKHTHETLHCAKCLKTFNADASEDDLGKCVGGSTHDLHGNLDGPGAPKEED